MLVVSCLLVDCRPPDEFSLCSPFYSSIYLSIHPSVVCICVYVCLVIELQMNKQSVSKYTDRWLSYACVFMHKERQREGVGGRRDDYFFCISMFVCQFIKISSFFFNEVKFLIEKKKPFNVQLQTGYIYTYDLSFNFYSFCANNTTLFNMWYIIEC